MDNFFLSCPARMSDGREFTDHRSSQIREEIFKYNNCLSSENEARSFRIKNGDEIMDHKWNTHIKDSFCYPRDHSYHHHTKSLVSNEYNNAELLSYNGLLPKPSNHPIDFHYRMTLTKKSKNDFDNHVNKNVMHSGYPVSHCTQKYKKTNKYIPTNLYFMNHELERRS